MKKLVHFDVLIVYAQSLARSASSESELVTTPFSPTSRNASYNTVYSYFLQTCRKNGLKAAFTTSADIVGPGLCRSYWQFNRGQWVKVNSPCFSPLIFDKFSPTTIGTKIRRQLLLSNTLTKPFNNSSLFELFFDKQATYDKLSIHSIPTVSINGITLNSVNTAIRALTKIMQSHRGVADFTTDIIMKDRHGAGGRHVYKFGRGQITEMLAVITRHPRISFIIQPFAKFDQGFSYRGQPASTDIRLIYLGGKIIQSYIRMAKTGDFRCNEHQGGQLNYLTLDQIPSSIVAASNRVAKILNKSSSLYALDFIIANSGTIYLLEGNTGPGLDWNMNIRRNTYEAKKLIRLIVSQLSLRTKTKIDNKPFMSPVFLGTPVSVPISSSPINVNIL